MSDQPKEANTLTPTNPAYRSHIGDPDYPDPTAEDLQSPEFEAVWQAIKGWDISRYPGCRMYSGATGNDVMHILRALRSVQQPATVVTSEALSLFNGMTSEELEALASSPTIVAHGVKP